MRERELRNSVAEAISFLHAKKRERETMRACSGVVWCGVGVCVCVCVSCVCVCVCVRERERERETQKFIHKDSDFMQCLFLQLCPC